MKKETIVIGLGNPLMADEGIGVEVVEKLGSACGSLPQVDFIDGGTGGMSLLYLIENRKKAIIIDCAFMDTDPGTIKRFTPDDVQSVKKLAHLSLHEIDILKVIELSRQLDQCPEEIVIFGIEPVAIKQQMGLCELLAENVDRYVDEIRRDL